MYSSGRTPRRGGDTGTSHGKDYRIEDKIAACVDSAKFQLGMLYILLSNGAQRAENIINNFKPTFSSKEEFLAFSDSLNSSGNRIEYSDDNSAMVNLK